MTRTKSKQRSLKLYEARERAHRTSGRIHVEQNRALTSSLLTFVTERVSFCFSYNFRKTVVNFNDYRIPTQ